MEDTRPVEATEVAINVRNVKKRMDEVLFQIL